MCPFAPFSHVQNLSLQSFKQANFCSVWFKSHVFVSSDCKFHKLTTLFCILLMCERLSNNSTNKIECRYMHATFSNISGSYFIYLLFRWFYYFNLHNNYLMCSLKKTLWHRVKSAANFKSCVVTKFAFKIFNRYISKEKGLSKNCHGYLFSTFHIFQVSAISLLKQNSKHLFSILFFLVLSNLKKISSNFWLAKPQNDSVSNNWGKLHNNGNWQIKVIKIKQKSFVKKSEIRTPIL